MEIALSRGAMSSDPNDLPVFKRARAFCLAVAAILERPGWRRSYKRWEQLADANESVMANMREGAEQSTDEGFANLLVYSKASLAEVLSRLELAQYRGLVKPKEFAELNAEGKEVARMLGGFINYLRRSGFKNRGSYLTKLPTPPRDSKDSKDSKDSGIRD